MNKKYERYIEYIVNDIEPPYFKNMEENYGLKDNEYSLVLSKLYDQPVRIDGDYDHQVTIAKNRIYDTNGNQTYAEDSDGSWTKYEYDDNGNEIYYEYNDGYWVKKEFDTNGNEIYSENSNDAWIKKEYDTNGNKIYYETSNGYWAKYEYDTNGNEIYRENSDGVIRDRRYE
jgi:uncharacterized membrane protein